MTYTAYSVILLVCLLVQVAWCSNLKKAQSGNDVAALKEYNDKFNKLQKTLDRQSDVASVMLYARNHEMPNLKELKKSLEQAKGDYRKNMENIVVPNRDEKNKRGYQNEKQKWCCYK